MLINLNNTALTQTPIIEGTEECKPFTDEEYARLRLAKSPFHMLKTPAPPVEPLEYTTRAELLVRDGSD